MGTNMLGKAMEVVFLGKQARRRRARLRQNSRPPEDAGVLMRLAETSRAVSRTIADQAGLPSPGSDAIPTTDRISEASGSGAIETSIKVASSTAAPPASSREVASPVAEHHDEKTPSSALSERRSRLLEAVRLIHRRKQNVFDGLSSDRRATIRLIAEYMLTPPSQRGPQNRAKPTVH